MADLGAIDEAIAALEAQRGLLGEAVVDTALKPLLEQRAGLIGRIGTEQRKLVTVLFSDLVDFTVLSQRLDAEDVRTVIDAYFLRWKEHIEANGGVVEKFIGDAVMAVFGLHRAAEDDPLRAIRAALAMRSTLDELNAEVGAAHGVTLAMRVGIDTGDVVVSTLGDRAGQDFVVVGDTVNRASRIQGAAPVGGVLISTDTYRHVRGAFDVKPMTGVALKGIAQPIDAYLIERERSRGFRIDGARGVEGVNTRTVGRELELRQLQEHFHEVTEEARWQVVTIIGDAGVGKSRLLSDFANWLDDLDDPVWWFGGRAAHSGPGLPYGLLHELFAARFDIDDSDEPADVRRKWEHGVELALGPGPDTVERAHSIARWLGFELGKDVGADGAQRDPQALGDRGMAAVAEYFRRLSEKAPVVLLLEDLHWADEAMLTLIHAAGTALGDCRMLVVGTARPDLLERHPHWGEGLDFHTLVPLSSLSRRETRRLLVEILQRAESVPQPLVDLVVTASEGNPFYVEELVKWLIEADVIVKHDDAWRVVDERLEQAEVPATLRSVLQARLDALSTAERLALQRASVIGRIFWDDAVESLRADDDHALTEAAGGTGAALDRLRGREVVYQREKSVFDHTREFLFKHALLRDVAYEGVLRRRRQTYHAYAARWFEQVAERTGRADQYADLIADHHANAGEDEAAARWYLVAGRQAASVNGLADARRLLAGGIERAPASAVLLRFDLLLAHESVLDRLGDRPAQETDLAALAALESATPDLDPARRVRLLLTRCRWSFHHSEYAVEASYAREGIDIARTAGLADLEAASRLWLGKGLTWSGHHQAAREALDAAMAVGRAIGDRAVVTEALRYLAIVASNVSEFPQAEALLAEAAAMHREDDNDEGESVVMVQLAAVLFNEGRYADARHTLEGVLPIIIESGFRYREAVVTANLAAIVVQMGELGQGRRLITRGLELATELDDIEGRATAYTIVGEIERRVGDVAGAEHSLRRVLEIAPERGFEVVASDALLSLALVTCDDGRPAEGLPHAEAAIAHGQRGDSPLAVARARFGLGYVLLALDEVDAATEALRAALDTAVELELTYLVVEIEAALARVATHRGDQDEACALAGRTLDAIVVPEILGAIHPGEIVRSCWQALVECRHPRAAEARAAARAYLDSAAALIDEPELRQSFRLLPVNVELERMLSAD